MVAMATKSSKARGGVTLIEMMVVIFIVAILMVGVGAVMVSSQSAWNSMYKRSYSGPVIDGVIVTKEFDRAVRKATTQQVNVDGTENPVSGTVGTTSLQVYYYKNPADFSVTNYDGYTKFYYVANEKKLKVDEGDLTPGTWTPANVTLTRTIAENVEGCTFRVPGASVEMVLRLDAGQNTDAKDGNVKMTVTCSAVRHNL
jgi:prepilin-type N-terminal cleavage/methylation domain-containing protein